MEELINLRKKIDELDNNLLQIISQRIKLMKIAGKIKKQLNLPIRDYNREEEKVKLLTEKAKKLKVPMNVFNRIWNVFFEISKDIEK